MQQAQQNNRTRDAEFFTAILTVLDGQAAALPEEHPYAEALHEIQTGMSAGGPEHAEAPVNILAEIVEAVRDFVNADDWDASRQVVEARQALLFQPEVETLFEQNIAGARAGGNQRAVEMLEMHLALLRLCKAIGIAEAFKQLEERNAEEQEEENDLPFDAELIPRSVAALLGSPQEKMVHVQYLMAMMNETTDEGLRELVNALQMALVGGDRSQLGRNLSGVYQQAWERITASVEAGGVDPQLFDAIATNTVAVLGPASSQRSEWRNTLAEVRNQAPTRGDRNMVALLDAVIGLLDVGGNPAGLGDRLKGIYAQTWQSIVEQLPG